MTEMAERTVTIGDIADTLAQEYADWIAYARHFHVEDERTRGALYALDHVALLYGIDNLETLARERLEAGYLDA